MLEIIVKELEAMEDDVTEICVKLYVLNTGEDDAPAEMLMLEDVVELANDAVSELVDGISVLEATVEEPLSAAELPIRVIELVDITL